MCWLGEIFSKKQRNGIIQLILQLHLHSTHSVIQLLHYRYPPFTRAPPPTPPPLPTHPLFSVPFPCPVGAAAPLLVEFGHLTLLNRLKLRLDTVGIDNDPTFVAPGTPVATPELFNNPDVMGPSTPDVMGFRIPESKPPTRPPPPLLLGAVAFWAWVALAVAEVKLAVLLVLLGKKVKAAEAFQVGRGAEEEVLA